MHMNSDAKDRLEGFDLDGRELSIVFAKERRKTPNEMRSVSRRDRSRDRDRRRSPRRRSRSRDRRRYVLKKSVVLRMCHST